MLDVRKRKQDHTKIEKTSPTVRRKSKYSHCTRHAAEDRRQKFHLCRLRNLSEGTFPWSNLLQDQ